MLAIVSGDHCVLALSCTFFSIPCFLTCPFADHRSRCWLCHDWRNVCGPWPECWRHYRKEWQEDETILRNELWHSHEEACRRGCWLQVWIPHRSNCSEPSIQELLEQNCAEGNRPMLLLPLKKLLPTLTTADLREGWHPEGEREKELGLASWEQWCSLICSWCGMLSLQHKLCALGSH